MTIRSTPQPATGSDFKLYYAVEATEATAPGGNWQQLPCISFELAGDQTLTQDKILSANQGRDAAEPYLDGVQSVKGNAKVPIDIANFGRWLTMIFGPPISNGNAPNFSHQWTSGAADATMISTSFEKAFPLIGKFYHDLGVRADGFTITTTPSGASEATIALMGLIESNAAASIAGIPTFNTLQRFMQMSGQVLLNGTPLAGVTAGTINFTNNMKAAITIRGDNRAESLDYGDATGGGSVTLRFTGLEGIDANALATTPMAFNYTLVSGAAALTFSYPRAYFKPVGPAITTPDAITRQYEFIAANDDTGTPLLTVTLNNAVPSY